MVVAKCRWFTSLGQWRVTPMVPVQSFLTADMILDDQIFALTA